MGHALRYLAARLARALLTIAGVVLLVFLLVRLVPGDPIDAILGDHASPEDRDPRPGGQDRYRGRQSRRAVLAQA
jgi:ABC-type dipeptide/oligopeptide/nickel transport system permease component